MTNCSQFQAVIRARSRGCSAALEMAWLLAWPPSKLQYRDIFRHSRKGSSSGSAQHTVTPTSLSNQIHCTSVKLLLISPASTFSIFHELFSETKTSVDIWWRRQWQWTVHCSMVVSWSPLPENFFPIVNIYNPVSKQTPTYLWQALMKLLTMLNDKHFCMDFMASLALFA